jgi:putative acetyltransferase
LPTIRKFAKKDAVVVAGLIRAALCRVSAGYYPKTIINNLIKEYSAKTLEEKSKTRLALVAKVKNKIVGTAQLTNDGWICGMFVHYGHQRMGVGTALLKKLECTARRRRVGVLRSHVAINSIGFYKKLGFKTVKMVTLKKAGVVYRIIKKLG